MPLGAWQVVEEGLTFYMMRNVDLQYGDGSYGLVERGFGVFEGEMKRYLLNTKWGFK